MRLGVVPYLNCLPLVSGFPAEIYEAPPAQLASVAAPEDIILAPIVAAFADPAWHLLEGVGIGSLGAVDTVKLFFTSSAITPQNIKAIYLDSESKTSVALLKVLLARHFNRPLPKISFSKNMDEKTQGALFIGDKVWEQKNFPSHLDLGKCWTDWTGLPFVYACWMTKSRQTGKEWKARLIAHAQNHLQSLDTLSEKISADKREKVLGYWRQLHYKVGPFEKKAIDTFQQEWASLEGKPILKLNWI